MFVRHRVPPLVSIAFDAFAASLSAPLLSAVVWLCIAGQPQHSQAIQVLDRCLPACVLLLQSFIDFVTLWVASKSTFSDFALVSISHKWLSPNVPRLHLRESNNRFDN